MPAPTLVVQTTYAELLERCAAASFRDAFSETGNFTSKTVRGRRYWYFQAQTESGRSQRYVGPETPQLLERIERHTEIRSDERERHTLVSTLVRSYGLPGPAAPVGEVIAALARAGVFRLRSVLVGTVAYQCYPAMLGMRLPGALLQTSDVDIAQFANVSVATGEQTAPMLKVLRDVEKSFREIPHTGGHEFTTSYVDRRGLRVEFLTPNVGPDTDKPHALAALRTDAQPLRFLDFLIHEPEQALVLFGSGVLVNVPTPERYAVHKLILSVRRRMGGVKRDKDLNQAQTLIAPLLEKRSREFVAVWEEAFARGPKWRQLLLDGMSRLETDATDSLLKALGRPREILPGIDLTFAGSVARYDSTREVITFTGQALGHEIECSVSREALEDHFDADNLDKRGRLDAFHKNRSEIEGMIRTMYLTWPVQAAGSVLLATLDVEKLRKAASRADL